MPLTPLSRRLTCFVALALCLVGNARAGFYRAPGASASGSVIDPPIAVSSNGRIAIVPDYDGPRAMGLLAFDPETGRRTSILRLANPGLTVKIVRVGSTDRVVSGIGGDFAVTLADLSDDGNLTLRATASASVNGSFPSSLSVSAQAGAYFAADQLGGTVDAFSLDNGQFLSRLEVSTRVEFIATVDGERPRLIVAPGDGSARLLVYDVSNPSEPSLLRTVLFPPGTAGSLTNEVTTRDGRYAIFSDLYFGTWTLDLNLYELLRFPDYFGSFFVRLAETGDRRIVCMHSSSTWLYDFDHPAQPHVLAIINPQSPRVENFLGDGSQLVVADGTGLHGFEPPTGEPLWSVPLDPIYTQVVGATVEPYGDGRVFAVWASQDPSPTSPGPLAASFAVPTIVSVSIRKKDLLVAGTGFEPGAVVSVDGTDVATRGAGGVLRAKRAAAALVSGQTVALRVRDASGTASVPFAFDVP